MVSQRKKLTVTVKRSLVAKDLVLADFVVKSIFMHNTETFRRYSDIYRAKQKSYGKFVVNYCLDPNHPSFFWLATLDKEVCSQLLGIALEYIDATNDAAGDGVPHLLSQVGEHDFSALQTAISSARGPKRADLQAVVPNYEQPVAVENQISSDTREEQILQSAMHNPLIEQAEEPWQGSSIVDAVVEGGDNPILRRIPLV